MATEDVQTVRVVGQTMNLADALQMFDTMIDVFEVLLQDPIRLARLLRLAALVEKMRDVLPVPPA